MASFNRLEITINQFIVRTVLFVGILVFQSYSLMLLLIISFYKELLNFKNQV